MVKQTTQWGLKNAHLEPWDFGRPGWSNERTSAFLIAPVKDSLVVETLRAGRPAEAVEALKISIWSRDTAEGRIALAEAYIKQQNNVAARSELEKALVLDPESAEARRLLESIR